MSTKFHPLKNYLQNSEEFATIRAKLQLNQGLFGQIQGLLPTPVREHFVGLAVKPDQLILYADSSAWASRIRYFTRELMGELDKKQLNFSKISIKVALDNRQRTSKSRHKRTKLLSAKNADQLQKVANSISDPELHAALMRLSSHKQSRK